MKYCTLKILPAAVYMPLETLLTTVKTKAEEAPPFPNDNKTPLPSGRHRRALTATLQAASQDRPAPPEQGSLAAIHRRPLPVRTSVLVIIYLLRVLLPLLPLRYLVLVH
jgi:hypothetical protein